MGDTFVTTQDIMTTLLTIEHTQRDYLIATDAHRRAIVINLQRTKVLAASVLEKHGILADFEKVTERCAVVDPSTLDPLDYSSLENGKDFIL
jgi:hypothetical protein